MMVAPDTNVVVRLLVADEKDQARRARELFERHDILLVSSVILESEWVLRSAYDFTPAEIADAFHRLFGLPQVTLSHPAIIRSTLDAYKAGLDFADALHLASSGPAGRFATFDKKLKTGAAQIEGCIDVIEP